jgi:ribosomal protein L29
MKKKTAEIKSKSAEELQKDITKTIEEIAKLKFDGLVTPNKNTNAVYQQRKQLARLKTALSLKQKEV